MNNALNLIMQYLRARSLVPRDGFKTLLMSFGDYFTRLVQPRRMDVSKGEIKTQQLDDLGRGERRQAVVRLANSVIVLVYLVVSYYPIDFDAGYPDWLVFSSGFIALSILVLVLTLRDTTSSIVRRTIMIGADVFAVSYLMVATGATGIPLFILYLSITLGNGFRFGIRAMTVSAVMSLIGFSMVLALSPAWQQLFTMGIAIMIALALLPFSVRFIRNVAGRRAETTSGAQSLPLPNGGNESARTPLKQRVRMFIPRLGPRRVDELGREQGQAVVRLINSVLVLAYLVINLYLIDFDGGFPNWLVVGIGFIGFSVFMLVLTSRDTASSIGRRMVGNVGDVCAISYGMIATGTTGIPLFIFYLSITLGNGFRFGLRAMKVSTVLSLIGFAAVFVLSPIWKELPVSVPVAIVLSLILLPAYAAHLISQLAKATKQAEEASAAKSRFLARMSHELRTPLNGILGTAELLATNKRLTREDRSLLGVIKDSVKVSMRQIDNVLDFSKIEAGKLAIEQVDFDLHELLNRALRLVRPIALEKKLRLTPRIDPAIPYRLRGDPHHLNEIFLNLLSNAVKFTQKGYVSLEARLVEADAQSVLIRFEVHDTGIGIEPAAIARIFEAFTQEDGGTTRRYGGTGLGTTIARQLVELMGGRLQVRSAKGDGSTFFAEIRFARQAEQTERAAIARLTGMRLLLVAKNAELHKHIASIVREWGVSLSDAPAVPEAIGLLARGIRLGNPVHVVLADGGVALNATGAHCAEELLQKASLSFTPVFLVSDVSPEEAQLRQWGYAGTLCYEAPHSMLFNALRASSSYDTDAERGIVRVEPWAWGEAARARQRILVADDNRTNLMILKKILETANYAVETAEDGERALELMLHRRYKMAVLDMHMPGLDGLDVVKRYRAQHSGAKIPVIILTANATFDAKVDSAEAGANAYLTKPVTATDLIDTIERLMEETEVYELKRSRPNPPAVQNVPVLQTEIITELDRLYGDPKEIGCLLSTFEQEGRQLLERLEAAIAHKNHPVFGELVHALKGNGANVGAARLVQTCGEIEGCGLVEFHREGKRLLARLDAAFVEAAKALHEFTAAAEPGPARDSDLS